MSEPSWVSLNDEQLLKVRICDLALTIAGTEIEDRVRELGQELEAKGLQFKPKVYLGDEWFSPEGVPSISVPFYLAHPRLRALEQKQMLEVEGGNPDWFMRLIRHEAGHCFDHAYQFSKRPKWRKIFGSPKQHYDPDTYRPRPYSKSFVQHLDNWYSQAHPDEDFAETFAVWLNPSSNWKEKYATWPIALGKLQYIDALAKEVATKAPVVKGGSHMSSASRLRSTLEAFYARKRKERAQDYPDFYDGDLRRIFNGASDLSKKEFSAEKFMMKNRTIIVDSVSRWSGERKFTINSLVKKLAHRCDSIELRLGKPETQTSVEVAAYLATLVSNYLFTGKFKRSY